MRHSQSHKIANSICQKAKIVIAQLEHKHVVMLESSDQIGLTLKKWQGNSFSESKTKMTNKKLKSKF